MITENTTIENITESDLEDLYEFSAIFHEGREAAQAGRQRWAPKNVKNIQRWLLGYDSVKAGR